MCSDYIIQNENGMLRGVTVLGRFILTLWTLVYTHEVYFYANVDWLWQDMKTESFWNVEKDWQSLLKYWKENIERKNYASGDYSFEGSAIQGINSMNLSDAYMRQLTRSRQVWTIIGLWLVACSAPSHYLNQWFISAVEYNWFENVVYKLTVILFQPQCVKSLGWSDAIWRRTVTGLSNSAYTAKPLYLKLRRLIINGGQMDTSMAPFTNIKV